MEIKTRAPGKIILSGEHAVLHGSTALAASLDLFTYVSLRFPSPSDNDNRLKLQLKDMALEFSWPISRIKEALPKSGGLTSLAPPASCSVESFKSIAALVEEQNIPEAKIGLASGVSAFLWLYSSIRGFKPATVIVTSELPLGSGLGSSAAFCVALAAALLAFTDSVNLDVNHQGWLSFGEKELELINKWAFEGEKIIHGKPSGIDNTVSTYGHMISFKAGKLTHMKSAVPLKMLITNTKVGGHTKALVAGVSERTLKHPGAMTFVFSAVDSISKELKTFIQSPAPDNLSVTEKEEKIEDLIEMNQGLLQCMGVSHATIETVLRTTMKYKLASKLTGVGGGGCVLTLMPTEQNRLIIAPEKKQEEFKTAVSEAARPFLATRTDRFVYEVQLFLASGLNIEAYDAVYFQRLGWSSPGLNAQASQSEFIDRTTVIPYLYIFDEDSDGNE